MSILQALARLGDRLGSDGRAPTFGFSKENISYTIVLIDGGTRWDVEDLRDTSEKTPRPKRLEVPRPEKRAGTRPPPNFLWDNTAYTFGVTRGKETKENTKVPTESRHAAFKEHHRRMLGTYNDAGAEALLRFLDTWRGEDYENLRHKDDMLSTNIVFRLAGERTYLHERDAIRRIWLDHLRRADNSRGLCLVTGEHAAIGRLHPRIKGVAGGQPGGGDIVSFNEPAFESYDKKQGANAPVSTDAAFAYTTALNTLLERNSRQHIRIGDTTTVFWAEAARTQAASAEDLFAMLLEPPTDAEETTEVATKMAAIADGKPLADVDPNLEEDTRFYVLGLAPNAGRISARFWYEDTIGAIARRIQEHWTDLHLDPTEWRTTPAAWRLLRETAAQHKAQNIPPTLAGALMRAILSGGRYPQSLFAAVVGRMRADKDVSGRRAAICKACLARDHRRGFEKEDVPVSLNRSETNTAYRLGRLFAVYERVQRAALGKVNATIKDRYFGAASATPASVFPMLERGSTSHLASLRKGNKGGLAHWYDREIDEILTGIQTEFPRSLRLADQGRFAIGYHHQRATKRAPEGETGPQVGDAQPRLPVQDED